MVLEIYKTFFFLLILGRNVPDMQTVFVRFIHQIHTICSVSLVDIFKVWSKTLTLIKAFWAVLTKKATNWDSEQLVCIIVHNCVVFGAKRIFPVSCGHTAHRDPLWSPALSRPVTWLLLHEMSNLYGADHSSFLSIAKEYQGKFPGSIPRLPSQSASGMWWSFFPKSFPLMSFAYYS